MAAAMKAIVQIVADPRMLDNVIKELVKVPEVEDVFEVSGEADVIIKVRAQDIATFRKLLKDVILKIDGVKLTITSVVLYVHKEAGAVAG